MQPIYAIVQLFAFSIVDLCASLNFLKIYKMKNEVREPALSGTKFNGIKIPDQAIGASIPLENLNKGNHCLNVVWN